MFYHFRILLVNFRQLESSHKILSDHFVEIMCVEDLHEVQYPCCLEVLIGGELVFTLNRMYFDSEKKTYTFSEFKAAYFKALNTPLQAIAGGKFGSNKATHTNTLYMPDQPANRI